MTRQECEERITEALKEIDSLTTLYNPTNTYLSMCIIHSDGNTSISFNNAYWTDDDETGANGEDFEHPIKYCTTIEEGITDE